MDTPASTVQPFPVPEGHSPAITEFLRAQERDAAAAIVEAVAASTTPPKDPELLLIWAQTPQGIAHFAELNRALMEKMVNAGAAERAVHIVS